MAVAPELAASEAVTAAPVTQAVAVVGPMPSLIDSLTGGAPLGETEVGKSWCLKALHPADTNVISSPMPTNETRAIASVGFNQMDLFNMPDSFNPNKPWNLTIYVHRDPVLLYSYAMSQTSTEPTLPVVGFVFSRQIGNAATYADAYQAIRTNCERFRLTSHSLTGYFDGASLSDQGHVVLGQTELPRVCAANWKHEQPYNDAGIVMPYTFYQDPPPSYELLLQTTRAYQGNAKDGFYVPSKMQNLGRWIYTNQAWVLVGTAPPGTGAENFRLWKDFAQTETEGDQLFNDFLSSFPYTRRFAGDPAPFVFAQTDPSLTTIMYTGLASTSTIRLTMRWTMDMIVRPGTIYAPFARMPPPEDPSALKIYAEVSRRMDDGYPSRYNNLGALLPILKNIVATVAPSVIPHLGTWIKQKIAARREQKKGPSAWELIMPHLTEAEGQRLVSLREKIKDGMLDTEEAAELAALEERVKRIQGGEPLVNVSQLAARAASAFLSRPRSFRGRSSSYRSSGKGYRKPYYRSSYGYKRYKPYYQRKSYGYGGYNRGYSSKYYNRRY